MHEAATPALPEASYLEEKGGCIATEVSPLSFETRHMLYTFSPPIKDQHWNTAEGQDISAAETQNHTPSSEP